LSRLRGLRGLGYIAELLRHPHEPIYVVDLIALGASEQRLDRDQIAEHGLRVSAEADVGPMLDRRARDDYRARWRELLVEQAEAQRDNDPGRAERVQRELDMLGAQLSAVGAGPGANGPSLKERARVNVRNCISAALRAIRARHNPLWRHLSNSIKTGAFCCYAPTARSSGTCRNVAQRRAALIRACLGAAQQRSSALRHKPERRFANG
jgi:non-specific serine/threonine protein kinase